MSVHTDDKHWVLLYYCFTPIDEPAAFRKFHHLYCIDLDLRGRIIIAPEGINGTVSGTEVACKKYMASLKENPQFKDIHFKVDTSNHSAFQKLNVRLKKEIVYAGLPTIKPYEKTGKHITPLELKELQGKEEIILLDARSNYEHRVGKFKGAVTLDINHFREFPSKIDELIPYKDKKIVTYCTGGVKCEKTSAYLLEQGFKEVYQLHGGIVQYGIDTNGEDFEGKCYVFDNRLTVNINKKNPSVISQCHICKTISDRMINCANPTCNAHIPMCTTCGEQMEGACSASCQKNPKKRFYDGTGYYITRMNGYNPNKGVRRKIYMESQQKAVC